MKSIKSLRKQSNEEQGGGASEQFSEPLQNPTMENLSTIFATIKKALHAKIDTTVTAV